MDTHALMAVAALAGRLERYSALRLGKRDAQRPDLFPVLCVQLAAVLEHSGEV